MSTNLFRRKAPERKVNGAAQWRAFRARSLLRRMENPSTEEPISPKGSRKRSVWGPKGNAPIEEPVSPKSAKGRKSHWGSPKDDQEPASPKSAKGRKSHWGPDVRDHVSKPM